MSHRMGRERHTFNRNAGAYLGYETMFVEQIFDAFIHAGNIAGRRHQIKEKREQIASVTSLRCGNCALWMTRKCVPEIVHKQFKSMNSRGCELLEWSSGAIRQRDQFTEELKVLESEPI